MRLSRRSVFLGAVSALAIASISPKASLAAFPRGSMQPAYSQAMGATDSTGLVVAYPLGQSSQTASGTWTTSTPNITMSGAAPSMVAPGMAVYDATAGAFLGLVKSYSGTSLVLQANAAHASSGSSDLLLFSASNVSTLPMQIFVNPATGSDSNNGLSPYAGQHMNGVGPNFQCGATGAGATAAGYGPKATFFAAYEMIAGVQNNRIGHQIFLAQGQSFYEGASTDSMNNRSGFIDGNGVIWPFCIQSYDPTDPLNTAKQGRATVANQPTLSTTIPTATFTGAISDGTGLNPGNILTVTGASSNVVMGGQTLTGASGKIVYQISGSTGSNGTYVVDTTQLVAATAMSSTGDAGQGNYSVVTSYQVYNPGAIATVGIPFGNYAIRGITFYSGTYNNCGLGFGGNPYNILVENCNFPGCGLGAGSAQTYRARNIILRKNIIYGNYSQVFATVPSGIGTGYVDQLVVEDNIIIYGGRKMGTARQDWSGTGHINGTTFTVDSTTAGAVTFGMKIDYANQGNGPIVVGGSGSTWTLSSSPGTIPMQAMVGIQNWNAFSTKHNIYAAIGNEDQSIFRRNVTIEGPNCGLSGRASILCYHGVSINDALPYAAGGGENNYSVEEPNGVQFYYHHSLAMGGANINDVTLTAYGCATQNGTLGSGCAYLLFINNPQYGGVNNKVFTSTANFNQPSYANYSGNVAYNYSDLFDQPTSSAPFPSQVLGPAVAGVNGNVNNLTSSPFTNAQIFAQLGFANETALINAMIANPLQNWSYTILQTVGQMFGFGFALGG